MIEKVSGLWEALLFAAMGAALGIGAMMASNQPISARLLVGRAISTAGVSVAAGAILLWFPDLPQLGRIVDPRRSWRVGRSRFGAHSDASHWSSEINRGERVYFGATATSPFIGSGAGSPAGVVVAPVGSMWLRTDGGASTTLYVKESCTDSSGWVAK